MSYITCKAEMIDVSKLPCFSPYRRDSEQMMKCERRNKLINMMIVGVVIGSIVGRLLSNYSFHQKLIKDHHRLDEMETRLYELKGQAFVNDNYKNKDFRREYLSLHEAVFKGKKEHAYRQTNTVYNILRKHNGVCDECAKLKKIGHRIY